MPEKTTRYVALLRGINVGGKNKLPMKDLVGMFEDAGATEVRSYIASGNVLFRATPRVAKGITTKVGASVKTRFGHQPPIVLRTAGEMREVAANNPFVKKGANPDSFAVMFLKDLPKPADVEALDPERSPGDAYALVGRDLYLKLGEGFADTKLTNAYFDSVLKTVSTARNWRTVQKLVELCGGDAA